jgi:hypothetical protein
VQVKKMRRTILVAAAACVAALALMLPMAGGAQAEQRNFCYGVNLAPNQGCQSGTWRMNAAFGNSMNGPICLYISPYFKCSKAANEGVYLNSGVCEYKAASIVNYNHYSIKGYGSFWTC